jgi:hypothetical protein
MPLSHGTGLPTAEGDEIKAPGDFLFAPIVTLQPVHVSLRAPQ